jgi:hypothetical protein
VSDTNSLVDELARRLATLNGAKPDAITMDIAADELRRIAEVEQRRQYEAELKATVVRP